MLSFLRGLLSRILNRGRDDRNLRRILGGCLARFLSRLGSYVLGRFRSGHRIRFRSGVLGRLGSYVLRRLGSRFRSGLRIRLGSRILSRLRGRLGSYVLGRLGSRFRSGLYRRLRNRILSGFHGGLRSRRNGRLRSGSNSRFCRRLDRRLRSRSYSRLSRRSCGRSNTGFGTCARSYSRRSGRFSGCILRGLYARTRRSTRACSRTSRSGGLGSRLRGSVRIRAGRSTCGRLSTNSGLSTRRSARLSGGLCLRFVSLIVPLSGGPCAHGCERGYCRLRGRCRVCGGVQGLACGADRVGRNLRRCLLQILSK
ncbi:hypothetical protein ROTMU0001_1014 [Rothia mucilaginosa ATCC 25296]|nr:hypothetical protein ROTMU0001_1014 [Rothia mucilaginosa ATCC 25296]